MQNSQPTSTPQPPTSSEPKIPTAPTSSDAPSSPAKEGKPKRIISRMENLLRHRHNPSPRAKAIREAFRQE